MPTVARSAEGRVHNRFLWCQRWLSTAGLGTIGIGGGTTNAATFQLEYSAVGYGRDDGQRAVTIFFRGENLVVTSAQGQSPSGVTVQSAHRVRLRGMPRRPGSKP